MKTPSLLATSVLALLPAISQGAKPTNFVLIYLDDSGYGDFSCNGAFGYTTPNIDKMASEGLRFTHYLAPQPVSGASRAGLLTGCYPNRVGFYGAPGPRSDVAIDADETTMGEMLQGVGYKTAVFGKWHLGCVPEKMPLQNGFDEYFGLPYSNDMWPHHPQTPKAYPPLPLYEGETVVEHDPDMNTLTTRYTEHAVDFITRNRKSPFFLYLAHSMPHVPLGVSDKFRGKSEQGMYGDVMMEIDWSVGEVLKTLRKYGLEKNTLVILTSDNGPWTNYGNHAGNTAGLREGKGTTFEGGNRVNCIMYWKGHIAEGQICNELISGIDIFPTFADIAGAPLPELPIDGLSLRDLLEGRTDKSPRENFVYWYGHNNLEAVTDGLYKLVFPHRHRTYGAFVPGNDGQPGKVIDIFLDHCELFDLRRDPGERYNVIDEFPEERAKLEAIADKYRALLGDDLTNIKGSERRPVGHEKEQTR